jgi:uncharacterized protein YndB with AHSA1/START domain
MSEQKAKRAARSVADLAQGTILANVEIAAAPERVFAALTQAEHVTRWWGSAETYRTTEWSADLRVGGRWRGAGRGADGAAFSVEGEFLEVDPPRKLVQTWRAAWDGDQVTTLTYRLDAIDGGTRVTVRHEGFAGRPESCANHTSGWEGVLQWLTGYLAPEKAAAPKRYFVSKLVPPRPSFPFDMSPAEGEVMQQHIVYWTALLNEGRALLFGPVGDPKGPYGLGVLVAKDEAEVAAIQKDDPAIRSGLGFNYEVSPMLDAVTRG